MTLIPDDLAWGFSHFEMTWLLYCAGAATEYMMHGQMEQPKISGVSELYGNNERHLSKAVTSLSQRKKQKIKWRDQVQDARRAKRVSPQVDRHVARVTLDPFEYTNSILH